MAFQIGLRLQPYSALHPSCRRSARWVTPGPSMQFRLQILLRPRTFSSVSGRDMRSINTATGVPKRFRVDNSSLIIGDELRHFQSMGATFSSPLMERGHAYFDRTRYISVLDEINKPILFFRPRRFGKSMTISMLEHFHGIQFRELHESLYQGLDVQKDIAEGKVTPGRYFVLKLDFSGIICSPDAEITNRSFKERLASSFRAFYNQYAKYLGRDKSKLLEHVSHENPEASLTNCVEVIKNELLDAQENDNKLLADVKGIYLLVDEYDAFSNAYIDPYYSNHGAEKVKISIDATFKAFWGRVESHLGINEIEKCFVTGISPLSLTDVGSGFNVAKNLSFHSDLAGLCGLTRTDIEAALKQTCGSDLEAKDKHLSLMTQYFNGYHFCRRSKVELMYNTETCLDYLQSVVKGQKPETVDPPNSEVSQEFVNRFASSPSAVRDFQAALKSEGNEFPLLPYTELLESFKLSDLTLDTENTEAAWRSLMLYFGALTFWPEDSEQFLKIPNVIAARRIAQAVLRKYGALKTLDSSLRFLESKGEIGDVLRHYRELMVQQDVAGQDFNKSEEMHRDLFYHTILRYHRPLLEYNVTKSDTKRTGRVDLLIPLSKHLILTEWKAARIKYLDVHVPGRKKPTLKAKAEVLSKYKLRDVLKLKYSDTDKFHPGETIENVIKDEAAPQLKQYVTSKEVVAKAEKGGLFLKAHVVFVVGSRHVLIWDMDCNGKLAEKPYLAQEMLDSEEDGEDEED